MVWGILLAMVALVVFLAARRWYVVKKFQKTAKEGDSCIIYMSNDKFKATIIQSRPELVIVNCMGNVFQRYRSDIYPL
jgi:hypothetical protein